MSFSDIILILALIGCITILYKKRKERKVSRPSRYAGKPTPKTKRPVGIKY